MAGRRLSKAVADQIGDSWGSDLHYVIAGLSNTYSSYITTFEEYSVQRYEGGFTLYGPHTLDAYIQEFRNLAAAMVKGEPTPEGPQPPNQLHAQWSLVPGVVADGVPSGVKFGDVFQDVEKKDYYLAGQEVNATFYSACPRNDIRAEGTFLSVERLVDDNGDGNGPSSGKSVGSENPQLDAFYRVTNWFFSTSNRAAFASQPPPPEPLSKWKVVYTDKDWETKFIWERHHFLSTNSFATIVWEIPPDVEPGVYRIRHFGNYKHLLGQVFPFKGASSTFEVKKEVPSSVFVRLINALGRRARAFRT